MKSKQITDQKRSKLYQEFIFNTPGFADNLNSAEASVLRFYQTTANNASAPSAPAYPSATAYPVGADINLEQVNERSRPLGFNQSSSPRVVHHHHHNDSNWFFWYWLMSSNNNANHTNQNSKTSQSNFFAYVVVLMLALAVVMPAFMGAYYLLNEIGASIERLWYNEGYFRAAFGLVSVIGSTLLAAFLADAFLNTLLFGLCLSAGFANPVAWCFFILIGVTLALAALIHMGIQELSYQASALVNKDELCPEDPIRFRVTDQDVERIQANDVAAGHRLASKLVDADMLQNVVTAIHFDIIDDPNYSPRFRFGPLFRSSTTSERLGAIRKLRLEGRMDPYKTTMVVGSTGADQAEIDIFFNNDCLAR